MFLLTLIIGIVGSLLAFSHIILFWLATYPEILWSFFFGLILASVWSVSQHIYQWNSNVIAAFVLGTLSAYIVTSFTPAASKTARMAPPANTPVPGAAGRSKTLAAPYLVKD